MFVLKTVSNICLAVAIDAKVTPLTKIGRKNNQNEKLNVGTNSQQARIQKYSISERLISLMAFTALL